MLGRLRRHVAGETASVHCQLPAGHDGAHTADRGHRGGTAVWPNTRGEALDRVRDLLFDWGQDFIDDEDVRMHDVLTDLWSAIARMPEGTKVDALPSRAPVLCSHNHPERFADTFDQLMDQLADLRFARQRALGLAETWTTATCQTDDAPCSWRRVAADCAGELREALADVREVRRG